MPRLWAVGQRRCSPPRDIAIEIVRCAERARYDDVPTFRECSGDRAGPAEVSEASLRSPVGGDQDIGPQMRSQVRMSSSSTSR